MKAGTFWAKSWQLSDSATGVSKQDSVQMLWPRGGKIVSVHVITTSVHKLYRCQVILARTRLDEPISHARYGASSDWDAEKETLLIHLAARWDIEVLFGESKEERGLDHSQLRSASALLRVWTLAMRASVLLEQEQHRWRDPFHRPVTIGEARREIQRRHRRGLLAWLHYQFLSGVHPESWFDLFAA